MWHHRLAHISERGLEELHKQGLIGTGSFEKLEFCEHCLFGKQKKVKFSHGSHTTKAIVDYVHSDIWGPTRVPSLGGARYFITFIDDWSRKVWVYLLKHKNQAFKCFKQWKALVENQTGRKVKVLRTDNGLEYLSEEFNEFCKDHGIARHKTVRLTPQQNGLAERMNRTILERVRCMLSNANLSKSFWGEAVHTACYLINRSPSTAIDFKTPEEKWSGKAPSYSHLRIFGCPAYIHVNEGKLEPRSRKAIFLGYPEGVKGYKVWLTGSGGGGKAVISRDVVFQEDSMLKNADNQPDTSQMHEKPDQRVQLEVERVTPARPNDEDQSYTQPLQDEEPSSSYNLVRDRERRQIRPPQRFGYADLIAYALNMELDDQGTDPSNYKEAIAGKDKDK